MDSVQACGMSPADNSSVMYADTPSMRGKRDGHRSVKLSEGISSAGNPKCVGFEGLDNTSDYY